MTKKYWKKRCKLAEKYINRIPCDDDITLEQINAHEKWAEFKNKDEHLGKALKWEELADEYDKSNSGRKARTLPMTTVFNWAEKQTTKFKVKKKKGTIHRIKT